jgi:hypothetical protein
VVSAYGALDEGTMGSVEGILYAECDIELAARRKLSREYVGHYNREDVF